MDSVQLRRKIRLLIEPAVQRLGYDLVAVEFLNGILRLSIDRANGEVSAHGCALVSRAVEPILDASDPIQGSYALEVSSPGMERPVQRREDFERFRGFRVRVRLEPGPARRRFTGEIVGTRGDDVLVLVDGVEHAFPLETMEKAHLDLTIEEFMALGKTPVAVAPTEAPDDHE
jgi:ribosome maturation factor RimP